MLKAIMHFFDDVASHHPSELGCDLVLLPDGDGLHHLLCAAAHPGVRGAVPLPRPAAAGAEGPQVGDALHSGCPLSPGRGLK